MFPRLVSLAVLSALIVLVGSAFYQVVVPFLLPLFLAAVLAVISQPLQRYFLKKSGGRAAWAAGLTTTALMAMLVVPLAVGTFIAAVQLRDVADQSLGRDWRDGLDLLWSRLLGLDLERLSPYVPGGLSDTRLVEIKTELSKNLQSLATMLAGKTFDFATSALGVFVSLAISGGMFVTALYYFLADGPAILAAAEELLPVPIEYQRRLADKFATVVRAVVTATFLAALAQGLATALALQFCGFGHFGVLLVIASIASLIPMAGAWLVWSPFVIWLALHGNWFAAIGLVIWGVAIVGMLDNGVKMYVLQSNADLHPLLAFISVIGALQVLGLWGIFIGPIVASCLFALIQIFNEELRALAKEREAAAETDPQQPLSATPLTSLSHENEDARTNEAVFAKRIVPAVASATAARPSKADRRHKR